MFVLDWAALGFAEKPHCVFATGKELVYRVGGGSSLALGNFFTPLKVDNVSTAELSLNIVLWGNRCLYVATYRVKPGTAMWIGRVAHGPHDICNRSAKQVFIKNPFLKVELVKDVEPLRQDLFVSPRVGHA